MSRTRHGLLLIAHFIGMHAFAATILAVTISDNRLLDPFLYIELGMGYSPLTNRQHTPCLGHQPQPSSYRLRLNIIHLDQGDESFLNHEIPLKRQILRAFIKRHQQSLKRTSFFASETTERPLSHALILVSMDDQGLNLNLGQSRMHPMPKMQLMETRMAEFAMQCGSHAVIHKAHFAYYAVMVSYLQVNQESDQLFFKRLRQALLRLHSRSQEQQWLEDQARKRLLHYSFEAIGLNSQFSEEAADHVIDSIESLITTIREVETFMQHGSAGQLGLIHAQHWNDIPRYQNHLLEQGVHLGFRAKLQSQTNFLAFSQLKYHWNHLENSSTKMTQCQRHLVEAYPTQGPGRYDPDQTFFADHSDPNNRSRWLSLRKLLKVISQESVERLQRQLEVFLYGNANQSGAFQCIEAFNSQEFFNKDFLDETACVAAIEQPRNETFYLDHYCLPLLVSSNQ